MNLFQAVKDAVPMRAAAENYGIKARKNGMAPCPFHDDHEPSLKLYEHRFHCFACGEDGDVIDFVSKLFNLNLKDAAEKLAADFGVPYDRSLSWKPQEPRPSVIAKLEAAKAYKKRESRCCQVLCDYFRLLQDWKERYAPLPTDEEWSPLFCEALGKTDYIEYLLDSLISGTLEDRTAIVDQTEKMVDSLEKRISEIKPTGRDCPPAVFKSGISASDGGRRISHADGLAV